MKSAVAAVSFLFPCRDPAAATLSSLAVAPVSADPAKTPAAAAAADLWVVVSVAAAAAAAGYYPSPILLGSFLLLRNTHLDRGRRGNPFHNIPPFIGTLWYFLGFIFRHYPLGCSWMRYWFSAGTHFAKWSAAPHSQHCEKIFFPLHIMISGIFGNFVLSRITWTAKTPEGTPSWLRIQANSFTCPYKAKTVLTWNFF